METYLPIRSIPHGHTPILHRRPVPSSRKERRDPRPRCPYPLRQRSLGGQLHIDLARQVLPFKLLVPSDVGSDHLPYLTRT
jgi:hypothetical protein